MKLTDSCRALIAVARRLDAKGLLTATDGNLSLRLEGGALLITPSGSCKGDLTEDELIVVESDGSFSGEAKPSSEIALHRAIYRLRPDVKAVVHAHPVYATAYAVAGIALDQPILSEVVLSLGMVPVVPYAMPTGDELAQSIEPFAASSEALLLRFHGAVTYGESIERAGLRMETLEHVAQIDFVRRSLGSTEVLPEAEVEKLQRLRNSVATPAGR